MPSENASSTEDIGPAMFLHVQFGSVLRCRSRGRATRLASKRHGRFLFVAFSPHHLTISQIAPCQTPLQPTKRWQNTPGLCHVSDSVGAPFTVPASPAEWQSPWSARQRSPGSRGRSVSAEAEEVTRTRWRRFP